MGEKQKTCQSRFGKTKRTDKKMAIFLDGLGRKENHPVFVGLPEVARDTRRNKSSVLFSKYGRTASFFTSDSKLYFTPEEYRKLQKGGKVARTVQRIDSLNSRNFENSPIRSLGQSDILYLQLRRKYSSLRNYLVDLIQGSVQGVSVTRMWNISIVGAVIFGMFTMTMIYHYLGQNVSAKIQETKEESQIQAEKEKDSLRMAKDSNALVAGTGSEEINEEIDVDSITSLLSEYEGKENKDFEKEILKMVKGYPIEKMVPEIVKKDRMVAAFLVAIAKKESNWGKRVPVLNGQDCYNYWGYRGKREKMGTGGHTCFNDPEDAVDTVAKRIEFLVSNEKLNTPGKMVVWKCGYDCSWDNKYAVQKWISDVDMYFKKLNKSY